MTNKLGGGANWLRLDPGYGDTLEVCTTTDRLMIPANGDIAPIPWCAYLTLPKGYIQFAYKEGQLFFRSKDTGNYGAWYKLTATLVE